MLDLDLGCAGEVGVAPGSLVFVQAEKARIW